MPESNDRQASSRDLAVAAARAAADKQGERVAVLDVRELIVITDYFVITSGSSQRQVRTIVEEIEKAMRDLGRKPVRREGVEDWRWVLLDYFDVVIHVFSDEEREYYDLERLWRDAPRVEFDDVGAASSSG